MQSMIREHAHRILNLILILVIGGYISLISIGIINPCVGKDIGCIYKYFDGILNPLYEGSLVLIVILTAMLFVPKHIYMKWLLWIGMPGVILIAAHVSNVSVYNSGVVSGSPAATAKVLMQLLGVVTALFVIGHIIFDRSPKRRKLK